MNDNVAWLDSLSNAAVAFAAEHWHVKDAVAYAQIRRAIKDEALSQQLPVDEFVEYVKLYAELDDTHPSKPYPSQPYIPKKLQTPSYYYLDDIGPKPTIKESKDYSWLWWLAIFSALWIFGLINNSTNEQPVTPTFSSSFSGDGRYQSASNTAQAILTEMEQDNQVQAWEYQETQSAGGCPNGCTTHLQGCEIKGNISFDSGEKIYHMPGQEFYAATNIDTSYGERWFCTEAEARNNGWRKAY